MLGVILGILKIIGIILLVILAVIVVLLALLLFWPVCYSGHLQADGGEIHAEGKAFWLLYAVHASGRFDRTDGQISKGGEVRLFGIPLVRLIRGAKEKKKKKQAAASVQKPETTPERKPSGRRPDGSAKKKPTVEPGRWKYNPGPETEAAAKNLKAEIVRKKEPNLFIKFTARIGALIGKLKKTFSSLRAACAKIKEWLVYLEGESFKRAKNRILSEGGAILKHILPKDVEGFVEFGMDDPSATGEILGAISVFYPVLPKSLKITPDFTGQKLRADVHTKGHLFLIVVLVRALKILLNKDVKALIARLKRRKKTGSSKTVYGQIRRRPKDGRKR